MDTSILLVFMGLIMISSYVLGRGRSLSSASEVGGIRFLNSLPSYYGILTLLWTAIPALVLLAIWSLFDDYILQNIIVSYLPESIRESKASEIGLVINQIYNYVNDPSSAEPAEYIIVAAAKVIQLEQLSRWLISAIVISVMIVGGSIAWSRIHPQMKARNHVERAFTLTLLICSCIAILTTIGIVLSVLFESLRFFSSVPVTDFLFGLEWSPQTAIRKDQVAGTSSFGAVPLFAGTLMIALIAMIVAVPTGLMSAIYLSDYAPIKVRNAVKPMLEILAGIPTVVYGFFAALTLAPFIRDLAVSAGIDSWLVVSSESALAAGLVMGIMIIPLVSSLSEDAIHAVPQSLRDGALGLGATKSEVVKQVVIPAALPGIIGGILLAVSRAIGETMIVVMAAGLAANLTANPFDSVTTVTVQIVTLLVGDQEFDSPKTLAAFALGLMLFVTTLALNYLALHVEKKYREQYD